jgi:alanine transaminase
MITLNELNPRLLHAQYAVRGPIVQRAQELEAQGKDHLLQYRESPGPQQSPLSFLRQALSLLETPRSWNRP